MRRKLIGYLKWGNYRYFVDLIALKQEYTSNQFSLAVIVNQDKVIRVFKVLEKIWDKAYIKKGFTDEIFEIRMPGELDDIVSIINKLDGMLELNVDIFKAVNELIMGVLDDSSG